MAHREEFPTSGVLAALDGRFRGRNAVGECRPATSNTEDEEQPMVTPSSDMQHVGVPRKAAHEEQGLSRMQAASTLQHSTG